MSRHCVYLVGTGPGDPELLTLKAVRLIQEADVVVYDRLVSQSIMEQVPSGIPRIYVGKRNGHHTFSQEQINQRLVTLAKSNRRVIRLKGGDPFVFGRGSEEAMHLLEHGVCFEVVPGVTSASACTTYAGIPLTHRGIANNVQIITGHSRDGQEPEQDWQSLNRPETTLVIYMGLANLPYITRRLIEAGFDPATPAAGIENGTTPQQRTCIATLVDLNQKLLSQRFEAPVMIVVGKVVELSSELDWFDTSSTHNAWHYEHTQ